MDLAADIVELAPFIPPAPTGPLREVQFRQNAWLRDEDDQLASMFAADEAVDAIATALGRTLHAVRTRIRDLGLRRNSHRPWSELEEAELVRRYGADSAADIARDFGRGVPAVYCRARLLGLTEGNAPPWTPWEDAQLEAGYRQGVPPAQVAVLIGRTMSAVNSRASSIGVRHLNHPEDWSTEEMNRALELAETGMRYLAIRKQMAAEGFPERSKSSFDQKIRKLGHGRGWGRAWLPDEDELLRQAYRDGASLTPLRTRLGRTPNSIRWRAGYLKLQGTHANKAGWRRGPNWTPEEEERLRQLFGTCNTKDLVATFNRPLRAIYSRANTLGLKHGFINDFSAEEDRAIEIAWLAGLGLPDLAHATGRVVEVVQKRAKRLGMMFTDPRRPAKPDRRRNKVRPTLAQILALQVDDTKLPPRPDRGNRGAGGHRSKEAA